MDYSGKDSSYTILNSNFFNCFSYTKNIIAVNIVNNP